MNCKNCGGPCKETPNGFVCIYCGATMAPEAVTTSFSSPKRHSGADVFEKSINGVLEIACVGRNAEWSGSGYLISLKGYAITNAHVAADQDGSPCKNMIAMLCGQPIPATVIALADDRAGSGSGIDLALIRLNYVPRDAVALPFLQNGNVRNGEEVFVIGNSLGRGTCITSGIVSDAERRMNGRWYLMTDCAVNGGNSGGPIFNSRGQVIGTITLQGRTRTGADAEGMNYAIPAEVVKRFIEAACQSGNIIL